VAPPYRVRARNTARASANRIHDDEVARQYGFREGLVPGVTVWAYLSHPVVEAWGRAWLERGSMRARFLSPLYDGDEAAVEADTSTGSGPVGESAAAAGEGGRRMTLGLRNSSGALCAAADAWLPEPALPGTPDPEALMARYPEAPLAVEPLPVSAEALASLAILGTHEVAFEATTGLDYLDAIGESLALYREQRLAHPGWLLQQANTALARNVGLGPWIHAGSTVHNLGPVENGSRLAVRGRTARVYERKGHRLVDLDLLCVSDGRTPVMRVEHTAIYEPRTP
jgi:acyl dehydratase